MSSVIEKLKLLLEEELKLGQTGFFSNHPAYIDLIEMLRHLDTAFIKLYSGEAETALDFKRFETYRYAWPRLTVRYLNRLEPLQAFLTTFSSQAQRVSAGRLLHWMGDLEMVDRWIDAHKAGLVNITEPVDNTFQLAFNHDIIEKEGYDRESYAFSKELAARTNQDAYQRHILKWKNVRKQMLTCLRIHGGTHISYGSTPDIDRYFSKLGYFQLAKEKSIMDFGPFDMFGGISYRKYINVLEELTGVALKHLEFCKLGRQQFPEASLHNNTVYTGYESETISSFASYLHMPVQEVKQVFGCLTLDLSNIETCLESKGGDLPPFFRTGLNQLTRTVYGVLGGGVSFLKRELKRQYKDDYFLAVNRREARFRQDIYQYFPDDRFVKLDKEVIINIPGVHTDIDAAIYDQKSRTLALFQLKWQDMFFTSLKERRSRISNSYKAAEEWIAKMQKWMALTSNSQVLEKLEFKSSNGAHERVFLFVISRNQIHYTGLEPEPVAAWASYFQMVESFEKHKIKTRDPIEDLYNRLKNGLPSNRAKKEGQATALEYAVQFKNFRFIFNGKASDYIHTEPQVDEG